MDFKEPFSRYAKYKAFQHTKILHNPKITIISNFKMHSWTIVMIGHTIIIPRAAAHLILMYYMPLWWRGKYFRCSFPLLVSIFWVVLSLRPVRKNLEDGKTLDAINTEYSLRQNNCMMAVWPTTTIVRGCILNFISKMFFSECVGLFVLKIAIWKPYKNITRGAGNSICILYLPGTSVASVRLPYIPYVPRTSVSSVRLPYRSWNFCEFCKISTPYIRTRNFCKRSCILYW